MARMRRQVPGRSAEAVEYIAAAVTLGPMVTALSKELGRRLGGSAADWLAKIHLGPGKSDPEYAEDLVVKTDGRATVFEVSDDLSDEARLALIDIDMTNTEIRGHRLRWDGHQWLSVGRR